MMRHKQQRWRKAAWRRQKKAAWRPQEAAFVAVQMNCQNATLCVYAYAMTCGITAHVKEAWKKASVQLVVTWDNCTHIRLSGEQRTLM